MKVEIKRKYLFSKSMTGELYVDGKFICYTSELDIDTDPDSPDGIPPGNYALVWNYSNRFKKMMYEIQGVKGRAGIRIHVGNVPDIDSTGCILVGLRLDGKGNVIESVRGYGKFLDATKERNGSISIIDEIDYKKIGVGLLGFLTFFFALK